MSFPVKSESDPTGVADATATDPDIPSEESGLAEHAALFDPNLTGDAKVEADAKKERIRHRARSQQARPEDVPRIQKMTREIRERDEKIAALEAKLAPVQQPPPTESQRVPAVPPAASPESKSQATGGQGEFQPSKPKPVPDDFEDWMTYNEALIDWKDEVKEERKQFENQQKQQQESAGKMQRKYFEGMQKYHSKLDEFVKDHPDYQTLIQQFPDVNFPPSVMQAIHWHDNGPDFVYHLMQHPDQLTEVLRLFRGDEPTDANVADATRWLSSRAQVGTTGSTASTPPVTPPSRPPNPVRSGPVKTSDDPPGDDDSLAAHEHAYGPNRRRR